MIKSRVVQYINVIKVVKESGVKYIIYMGFMRIYDDFKFLFWFIIEDYVKIEKYFKELGIIYIFFVNVFYLDMLMDFVGEQVLEIKIIFVLVGDGKINFVFCNEIVEVFVNVLIMGGYENKIYNIGIE